MLMASTTESVDVKKKIYAPVAGAINYTLLDLRPTAFQAILSLKRILLHVLFCFFFSWFLLVCPSANDLNFKPLVFRWKSLLSPSIYNSITNFSKTLTQDKKAIKRVRGLSKCLVKKFFLVFFLEFSFMVMNIELFGIAFLSPRESH